MKHAEHPGLLAAVIANAENDAPRLVYADWLDEHGHGARAEFIRVQCALFDKSPADADYADLVERKRDVLAALRRHPLPEPAPPDGVGFHDNWHEERDDAAAGYHRGFPYFAGEPYVEGGLVDHRHARKFRAALPRMINTTTLRGLHFHGWFIDHLVEILSAPATKHLSAISVDTTPVGLDGDIGVAQAVASSPAVENLRWLDLTSLSTWEEVDLLAGAKAFGRLRRLTVRWVDCPPASLKRLTTSSWFGRLRRVEVEFTPETAAVGLAGLAKLPDLHTLGLLALPGEGVAALAKAGAFPALGELSVRGPVGEEIATGLAKARMPRLAVLKLSGDLGNDGLAVLARSELFARLSVLSLMRVGIGDKGVAAVAASPSAATLRVLSLGDNKFGKGGLTTLARPGAFPNLTTLSLRSSVKRKATAADVTQFLTRLALTSLRELDLRGWPVDDAGAKALAANPSFANLSRLNLGYCQVGPKGAAALFGSPSLQRLVKLDLTSNPMGKAVETLRDPRVMPNLGECWLPAGVPDDLKEKLAARRGDIFL